MQVSKCVIYLRKLIELFDQVANYELFEWRAIEALSHRKSRLLQRRSSRSECGTETNWSGVEIGWDYGRTEFYRHNDGQGDVGGNKEMIICSRNIFRRGY
jgi:hypothetical protein